MIVPLLVRLVSTRGAEVLELPKEPVLCPKPGLRAVIVPLRVLLVNALAPSLSAAAPIVGGWGKSEALIVPLLLRPFTTAEGATGFAGCTGALN